jgi:hypothetical protein
MAHRLGGRERLQLCIGGEEAANTTQPAATCRPRKCRRGATEAHPLGADPASKRKQHMISACLRLADPDLSSSWTSWRRRARTKRPSGTSIPSRAVAKGVQPRLLRLLRRVAMTAQKSHGGCAPSPPPLRATRAGRRGGGVRCARRLPQRGPSGKGMG